ncbi:MAG: hypothetical protein RIB93_01255 [Coleofasciculus sp. D1-CHI-01]|uniref:hypothetical protein n=1 Tax=Coleofasciculus sp. D1-CHI-01 TaxID=3068482 RepID=UPI003301974C
MTTITQALNQSRRFPSGQLNCAIAFFSPTPVRSVFEPFRNAVTPSQIRSCLSKIC